MGTNGPAQDLKRPGAEINRPAASGDGSDTRTLERGRSVGYRGRDLVGFAPELRCEGQAISSIFTKAPNPPTGWSTATTTRIFTRGSIFAKEPPQPASG